MTHLYIEQNTGLTEEVNSSIISKLYELAISGDLDNTSDLKGRLHLTIGYRQPISYLNNTYQDLYITADDYAIPFEDPNMLQYLLDKGIGSNGMITEDQAAAVTSVADAANTTVTKFNELKYFTSITESKGGYASTQTGNIRFYGWTALEEVDISNFTSISHIGNGFDESFSNCTNLKKVTASDKLTKIGTCAFQNCGNLETISGLSGTITVNDASFKNCTKLKQENFNNVVFHIESDVSNRGVSCFEICNALTSITFDGELTKVPQKLCFYCTGLQSITGLNNVTIIDANSFNHCTSLQSTDIDFSNVTSIGESAFESCTSLAIANLSCPNLTSLGISAFKRCTGLTSIDLSESSIAVVSRQAFEGCNNLSKLKFPSTAINLNELWCNNVASTLYITGLDNINTHSQYNWNIENKSIQNPIKDSLNTGGAIVRNTGNNTVTSIHSLYEPTRVSTPVGEMNQSYNVNGWLVYASGGNAMMNIGLLYFRDITSFGYVTFYRCNITNLVINNVTPPTHSTNSNQSDDTAYYPSWGNSIFGDQTSSYLGNKAFIGTLWVPDSAVATYQADPQYSGLTIKGINTKTNGVDYDLPRYADFSAWEAAEEAAVAQGGHAPQGLIESWM